MPAFVNEDVGVPVFPYDLPDRPYTVVGEVKAGVRKATVFSKSPSQAKIYKELWERAEKLGADAVITRDLGDHLLGQEAGEVAVDGVGFDRAMIAAAPQRHDRRDRQRQHQKDQHERMLT